MDPGHPITRTVLAAQPEGVDLAIIRAHIYNSICDYRRGANAIAAEMVAPELSARGRVESVEPPVIGAYVDDSICHSRAAA